MRLQAVDHMMVGLNDIHYFMAKSIPNEDMAAIRSTHDIVVTPKAGFLDLGRDSESKPRVTQKGAV